MTPYQLLTYSTTLETKSLFFSVFVFIILQPVMNLVLIHISSNGSQYLLSFRVYWSPRFPYLLISFLCMHVYADVYEVSE